MEARAIHTASQIMAIPLTAAHGPPPQSRASPLGPEPSSAAGVRSIAAAALQSGHCRWRCPAACPDPLEVVWPAARPSELASPPPTETAVAREWSTAAMRGAQQAVTVLVAWQKGCGLKASRTHGQANQGTGFHAHAGGSRPRGWACGLAAHREQLPEHHAEAAAAHYLQEMRSICRRRAWPNEEHGLACGQAGGQVSTWAGRAGGIT